MTSNSEKIKKRYNLMSSFYDILDFGGVGRNKKLAVDMLKLKPDAKVMDIGSGTGAIAPYVADKLKSGQIICVDFSDKMVDIANKRFSKKGIRDKAKSVVLDGAKLPFPKNHFDAILATYAFTSFPEPEKAIKECSRVLKKGGRISILDTGKSSKNKTIYNILRLFMKQVGHTDISVDVLKHVKKSGLKVKEIRRLRNFTYIIIATKEKV